MGLLGLASITVINNLNTNNILFKIEAWVEDIAETVDATGVEDIEVVFRSDSQGEFISNWAYIGWPS